MATAGRDQLEWEARAGRPAAAAAAGAIALFVAGTLLEASALSAPSSEEAEDGSALLRAIHDAEAEFIGASVIQGLSFVLLAGVLAYLYKITSHRHDRLPNVALVLGVAGPILFGIAGVLLDISRAGQADDFLREMTGYTPPLFAEADAEELLDERDGVAVALGAGGTLGLAFSMVLLNLNAMRVGLLSRFLGVIGIITGALYVIPVFTGPAILQLFWLGSLALLFLDRWPGGRGPAWESGEPVPWPSAAERRGLVPAKNGEHSEAGKAAEPKPDDPDRPRPQKRKRKRRR